MNKDSINIAVDVIVNALDTCEMNPVDKVELLINLSKFLQSYDNNIRVLRKVDKEWNKENFNT